MSHLYLSYFPNRGRIWSKGGVVLATFKTEGFDELEKELKRLERNVSKPAEEFNGDVGLEKLLDADFIKKHTKFDNADSWLTAGGFTFETQEEYDNLDENELDSYVRNSSDFSSWQAMLESAAEIAITRSLDF